MRFLLPLAATALLALPGATAPASVTLLPPSGQYLGKADNGANIIFTLDQTDLDHIKVRDFYVHGHKRFSAATFRYGNHNFGSFRIELRDGFHAWGHWSQNDYGHVSGGYSYLYRHHRYTHHWRAAADGFDCGC